MTKDTPRTFCHSFYSTFWCIKLEKYCKLNVFLGMHFYCMFLWVFTSLAALNKLALSFSAICVFTAISFIDLYSSASSYGVTNSRAFNWINRGFSVVKNGPHFLRFRAAVILLFPKNRLLELVDLDLLSVFGIRPLLASSLFYHIIMGLHGNKAQVSPTHRPAQFNNKNQQFRMKNSLLKRLAGIRVMVS